MVAPAPFREFRRRALYPLGAGPLGVGLTALLVFCACGGTYAADGSPTPAALPEAAALPRVDRDVSVDQLRRGAVVWTERCADCHGERGEGVEFLFERPLQGDKPLHELADLVTATMPDGSPEDVTGDDAAAVSAFIRAAFYTREARTALAPPRIAFSRLTVPQFRNSVSDLIDTFQGGEEPGTERGLTAEFYPTKSPWKDKAFERVDRRVDFDFDGPVKSPDGKTTVGPKEFAARWSGVVIAEETGEYGFRVSSPNAVTLYVNGNDAALIENRVLSGDMTAHDATVPLLAGRAHRLRLEMSKEGPRGKNDGSSRNDGGVAAVTLEWKRPDGDWEVIPPRNLAPVGWREERFVPVTPFPPDDNSYGFERGTAVSAAWDAAVTDVALDAAGWVAERLDRLSGFREAKRRKKADDGERADYAKKFAEKFVATALLHPLSDEERRVFVDERFVDAPDPETAVKRVVLLTLKNPRFLYPELAAVTDRAAGVEKAEWRAAARRLSLALWDSIPDAAVRDGIDGGWFNSEQHVREQALRMLEDPRAKQKLRGFLAAWLMFDRSEGVVKDDTLYPGFEPALLDDLRTSLVLFAEDVVWGENPNFSRLLLDRSLPMSERMAAFYGVELPAGDDFRDAFLDGPDGGPDRRAGVLTHPLTLSSLAHHAETSPIHRGVFLSRNVLGRVLPAPPDDVPPLTDDFHPDATLRERVVKLTEAKTCMGCHGMINPLGFAFEGFDAVGRYRETEAHGPVDTTGTYHAADGSTAEFAAARDLAEYLADSPEVHRNFAERLFHHVAKQPVAAYGPDAARRLLDAFTESKLNVRSLLVEAAVIAALPPDAAP